MANTASNVSVGKPKVGGAIYRAPAGTTLPTDASTALASTFVCLGYCSEDGLTNGVTKESADIKDWSGSTVLSAQTGHKDTFKFKLIEALNKDVLSAVFGSANVTGTSLATGIEVTVDGDEPEEAVWVAEIVMTGNVAKRIVIPSATVSELGEIVYKPGEPVGYEVTLSAAPDSNGKTHTEYLKGSSSSDT